MSGPFDPCHEWLGIPPEEQPANHYRLLGIKPFEENARVIEHAADRQMAHLRTFQAGKQSALSQKLLNEVAAAKICLLNPGKKAAYDAKLRAALSAQGETSEDSFGRQMAELLADAKPTRTRASRSAVPTILLGGVAVGVLLIGAVLWAFFAAGRPQRSEAPRPVAMAQSEKPKQTAPRDTVPQAAPIPPKKTTENRGEKKGEAGPGESGKPAVEKRAIPAPAPQPVAAAPMPAPVGQPPAAAAAPSQSRLPNSELKKLPVPDAKALDEGLKIARDAYQGDYARAQTPLARRDLAKKILQQALEQKDDAVARFVLLRLARDVALMAEDTGLAYEAIERMAEGFEVDPWAMKSEIVLAAAKQARKTAEHKAAAEQALALMRQALEADSCDVAQDMAKLALAEGGKARDKELVAQARAGQKQAQQAAKGLEQVEAARAILKDNPGDPAANLTVGRYECFTKGDWDKGLAHLAKGRDASLAELAKRDLVASRGREPPGGQTARDAAHPEAHAPGSSLALGDAWWDLAQKAEAREKDAMLLRAGYWYQQLGEIEQALVRTKVENRLAQIAKLGRAISGAPAQKTLTNSIGMQLVLIPAGEFLMGSSPEEIAWAAEEAKKRNDSGALDRIPSEAPRHPVRISRPFYLGMYEVTQGEYEQVMGANPSSFSAKGKDAGKVTGMDTGRHPVEMVSWEDVAAFCQKLSALPKERSARRVYRLPTEAEWEYACRAGSTTKWSFGDDQAALAEHAWFSSSSSGMTHPVGQKKPNGFGLFDMHGNVGEWCMDWFGQEYYRQSPLVDPIGPSSASSRVARVLRGGAWDFVPSRCRSALRSWCGPAIHGQFNGFRVVVVR